MTVAFVAAVVIGGGNFVAVSFSNQELPPFWGAGLRFALAAVLFILVSLALRLQWPRGRTLALTAAYGVFTFALSYALMYWALTQMNAGSAAVVLATVPLVTSLLAAVQRLELLDRRALLGAVLALAGIVWMSMDGDGLAIPLGAVVAALFASVTIGESIIISKRISGNHPAMNNAVGMVVGASLLLILSWAVGESWTVPTQQDTIVAVIYLVTVGSVGLFVLSLLVVRRWTASATAYMFVLFPVVAMLFDAWLLDAPLTLRGVSGAIVVMVSVWFGAFSSTAAKPVSGVGEVSETPGPDVGVAIQEGHGPGGDR